MSFYDDAATLALEQLTEFGRVVPLQRYGKTLDPVKGTTSSSGYLETEATLMIVPINKTDIGKLDNRLKEALTQGRLRKYIVAALGLLFDPLPLDVVTLGQEYWVVAGSTPLCPAETPVLHYVIVERGSLSAADQAATNVTDLEEAANGLHVLVHQTLPALL